MKYTVPWVPTQAAASLAMMSTNGFQGDLSEFRKCKNIYVSDQAMFDETSEQEILSQV